MTVGDAASSCVLLSSDLPPQGDGQSHRPRAIEVGIIEAEGRLGGPLLPARPPQSLSTRHLQHFNTCSLSFPSCFNLSQHFLGALW